MLLSIILTTNNNVNNEIGWEHIVFLIFLVVFFVSGFCFFVFKNFQSQSKQKSKIKKQTVKINNINVKTNDEIDNTLLEQ